MTLPSNHGGDSLIAWEQHNSRNITFVYLVDLFYRVAAYIFGVGE